jgi:hypothetical protein
MITFPLSPWTLKSPPALASTRLFRIRIVRSAMTSMSSETRKSVSSRRAETSASLRRKSRSARSGYRFFV